MKYNYQKKILTGILILSSCLCFADPAPPNDNVADNSTIIQPQPSLAQIESASMANKSNVGVALSNTFSMSRPVNLIDPVATLNGKGDLLIKETMINQDIGLMLINQSQSTITIQRVGLMMGNQECAFADNLNLKINGKQTKSGYWYPRSQEIACQQAISQNMPDGKYNLIDISSQFNPIKYQSYAFGLFLYPMVITVNYSVNNIQAKTYKNTFYIYARQ